jgi:hypothetical protein
LRFADTVIMKTMMQAGTNMMTTIEVWITTMIYVRVTLQLADTVIMKMMTEVATMNHDRHILSARRHGHQKPTW